jgi:hypothetical protein
MDDDRTKRPTSPASEGVQQETDDTIFVDVACELPGRPEDSLVLSLRVRDSFFIFLGSLAF